MKKLVLILAVAVFALQSCTTSQAENKSSENSSASETTDQTVAANDNEGEKVTQMLTKEIFLNNVWDYENSPQEWVFKGDKPVLIDFYADWCGPCKIASPILEEVAQDYVGEIQVYKIDTEVEKELAAVFGISSIPAFLYIPMEGKPTMSAGIARTEEGTREMFKTNIEQLLLAAN